MQAFRLSIFLIACRKATFAVQTPLNMTKGFVNFLVLFVVGGAVTETERRGGTCVREFRSLFESFLEVRSIVFSIGHIKKYQLFLLFVFENIRFEVLTGRHFNLKFPMGTREPHFSARCPIFFFFLRRLRRRTCSLKLAANCVRANSVGGPGA